MRGGIAGGASEAQARQEVRKASLTSTGTAASSAAGEVARAYALHAQERFALSAPAQLGSIDAFISHRSEPRARCARCARTVA